MVDALGTAASVLAVLQLSAQTAYLSFDYLNGVKRAPEELVKLVNELKNLYNALIMLDIFVRENPAVAALWELDEPLQRFTKDMIGLKAKLELKGTWLGIPVSRIQWPLREKETRDYILRIEGLKSLFILAMSGDQISKLKHIAGGVERIETHLEVGGVAMQSIGAGVQNIGVDVQDIKAAQLSSKIEADAYRAAKKRMSVLDWLYPEAFDRRHTEICDKRQEHTGQWILSAPEIQEWRRSPQKPLVWGYGIPGAGKTFLSSVMINHLQNQASTKNYGVAYIYFNFSEQLQQGPRDVLSSLVKQLACYIPLGIPKWIEDLYDKLKPQKIRPTLEELYSAFLEVLKSAAFAETFIVGDALDECNEETRQEILPMFHKMGNDGVKLFITSRGHLEDIRSSFRDSVKIEILAKEDDIAIYIEQKIEKNARAKRLIATSNCKDRIISELTKCSNGIFLLVHFHIEHVCQQTTARQVLIELEKIGSASNDETHLKPTYDKAFEILQAQPRNCVDLAMKVFSWLMRAQRVLTVRELQLAVSMKEGQTIFDEDDLPDEDTIVEVCASLVTIDQKSSTVRFIHYSAQEYLGSCHILSRWEIDIELAVSCATFLSLDIFSCPCDSNDSLDSRYHSYPFLDYAVTYLRHHLASCGGGPKDMLMLYFASSIGNFSSYLQALVAQEPELPGQYSISNRYNEYPKGLSPLHAAAYLGNISVFRMILEKGADLEATDDLGRTPIFYAAFQEHHGIACLLVNEGASLPAGVVDGLEAMVWAESYGLSFGRALAPNKCEQMVRTLIQKGVDFSSVRESGATAMHYAAQTGYVSVVQLLIEQGLDPSQVERTYGCTPMHWAIQSKHAEVVQLLLEKGANPLLVNLHGETPLHLAARSGLKSLVQLLLDNGADPSLKDNDGRLAMDWEAIREQERLDQIQRDLDGDLS